MYVFQVIKPQYEQLNTDTGQDLSQCGAFTLKEGNRSAPLRENPSTPPLFAQSTRDMRGSRGRLTFSSFFSSSRKADTPRAIVWKG